MTKVKREWLDTNLIGNPLEEELKALHHSGTVIGVHPVGVACIWGLRELDAKDARIAELETVLREATRICDDDYTWRYKALTLLDDSNA